MVAVIVALLAWSLYLRGQVRNADQAVATGPVTVTRGPEPTTVDDQLPDVTMMDTSLARPAQDKDMVELLHDYDRAAAALITSVGAGPVPEEHRLRLKRVLAGVSEKEEFLAEASALADGATEEEARPWLDEMRSSRESPAGGEVEDVASQTLIMSALEPRPPKEPAAAEPTEIPEGGAKKTSTNTAGLKEVDTLIAFENYEQASELLNQLLDEAPANPEYRLRLLHILSAAGKTEASAEQEEILAAMMDGPLSETLSRVRRIGRDLLPGHPLFTGSDEAPVAPAEAAFDTDPVFDITFSEDADEGVAADFDPLGDDDPTEVPTPVVPDTASVDADLDDFMKSAFDAPESQPPGGRVLDLGFDLATELDSQPDEDAGAGELSFETDPPEITDAPSTLSMDIDNEFDVLLDELLEEDAGRDAPPRGGTLPGAPGRSGQQKSGRRHARFDFE